MVLPIFAFEELSERPESQRGQELTWGSPAGKGGQAGGAGAEDRRPASFRWPVCLSSWARVGGALSWPITLSTIFRPRLWDMIQASWKLGCESGFLGREFPGQGVQCLRFCPYSAADLPVTFSHCLLMSLLCLACAEH